MNLYINVLSHIIGIFLLESLILLIGIISRKLIVSISWMRISASFPITIILLIASMFYSTILAWVEKPTCIFSVTVQTESAISLLPKLSLLLLLRLLDLISLLLPIGIIWLILLHILTKCRLKLKVITSYIMLLIIKIITRVGFISSS